MPANRARTAAQRSAGEMERFHRTGRLRQSALRSTGFALAILSRDLPPRATTPARRPLEAETTIHCRGIRSSRRQDRIRISASLPRRSRCGSRNGVPPTIGAADGKRRSSKQLRGLLRNRIGEALREFAATAILPARLLPNEGAQPACCSCPKLPLAY